MTTEGVPDTWMARTKWFGEPWPRPDWRAPICEDDADRIPIPVGTPCYRCGELIDEDDQGTASPGWIGMGANDKPEWHPEPLYDHKECGLRAVLGCYGVVSGNGHTHDVPYRQDALRVQQWLEEHGR